MTRLWPVLHVRLTCGHSFTEHRPGDMYPPVDGELRACGHPEHYPARYGATYFVPLAELASDPCPSCHDTGTFEEPVSGRFAVHDSRSVPCPYCDSGPK